MARGHGEGSIGWRTVTRKGKRYRYCRGALPPGPDGRRREKLAKTRDEILDWLAKEVPRQRRGLAPRERVMLGEYSVDWLASTALRVKPTTLEFYRFALKHTIRLAAVPIEDVTVQHVRNLIREGREAGRSSRTVRGVVQTLSYVLGQAEADGLVDRNVAKLVRLPKLETKETAHFTPEQARRFLEVAKDDDPELFGLYAVALGTGLRRGELLALGWRDVALDEGQIVVRRAKTEAGLRRVPIPAFAVAALAAIPKSLGPIWPYRPEYVTRRFKDLCERAGVPAITLHGLRHTASTLMAEQDVPIEVRRWILGHSKTEQTAHYSHESERLMRDAVERLGRAVG